MTGGVLLGLGTVGPIVFFYLLVVRWAHRFEPAPPWLLASMFAWGAVVAATASYGGIGLAEHGMAAFLRVDPEGLVVVATSDALIAPVLEEVFKGAGLLVVLMLSEWWLEGLNGPVDGLICGAVIGLGFSLTEDALYVSWAFTHEGYGAALSTTFLRTLIGGLGHCTFTALTGLGFGIALEARRPFTRVAAPLVLGTAAVTLHVLHNVLDAADGSGIFLRIVVFWAVDAAFFVGLGLGLRHRHAVILRELRPEVGGLLQRGEVEAVASYVALDRLLLRRLFVRGMADYQAHVEKRRLLAKLAVLKHRRRSGWDGPRPAALEAALRSRVARLNEQRIELRLGVA